MFLSRPALRSLWVSPNADGPDFSGRADPTLKGLSMAVAPPPVSAATCSDLSRPRMGRFPPRMGRTC